MRLFHTFAVPLVAFLSADLAQAGVAKDSRDLALVKRGGLINRLLHVFQKKQAPSTVICTTDAVLEWAATNTLATEACSRLFQSQNFTVTVSVTRTTAEVSITGVRTVYDPSTVHVTATETSTVTTPDAGQKRAAAPEPTVAAFLEERGELSADFQNAVELVAIAQTYDPSVFADWAPVLSSACVCLQLGGATVTSTGTTTVTTTVNAYQVVEAPMNVTVADSTSTTTVTVMRNGNSTYSAPVGLPTYPSGAIGLREGTMCPAGANAQLPEQSVILNSTLYSYVPFCGYNFANETALTALNSPDLYSCGIECFNVDDNVDGAGCKGYTFDGTTCSLFATASGSGLVTDPTMEGGILVSVIPLQPTETVPFNSSPDSDQVRSALVTITGQVVTITSPPAITTIGQNTLTFSSCSTGSYSNSTDHLEYSTWTCTQNSSWTANIVETYTAVYSSDLTILASGAGGNGSNGGGAGSGPTTSTIVINGTTILSVISGSGETGTGGGGVVSTVTTTGENFTSTYLTTIATGGAGGSGIAGGGPILTTVTTTGENFTSTYLSTVETGGSGETGTGGREPVLSTVTEIGDNFTSVYVTTIPIGGSGGTGTGGGGPILTTVTQPGDNFTSTFVSTITTGGSGGFGTGGGGPILTTVTQTGDNFTSTFVSTIPTGGASDSGNGGGGPISPSVTPAPSTSSILWTTITTVSNGTLTTLTIPVDNRDFGSDSDSSTVPPASLTTITVVVSNITITQVSTLPISGLSGTVTGTGGTGPLTSSEGFFNGSAPSSMSGTGIGTGSFPSASVSDNSTFPTTIPSNTTFPNTTASVSIDNPSISGNPRSGDDSDSSSTPFPGTISASPTGFPNSTCFGGPPQTVTVTVNSPPAGCELVCTTDAFPSMYSPILPPIYGGGGSPTDSAILPSASNDNGTVSIQTSPPTPPTSDTTSPPSATPTLDRVGNPPYLPRAAGTPATPDQIDAACAFAGNQVYNGEFEISTMGAGALRPSGWSFATNEGGEDQVYIVTNATDQETLGGSNYLRYESDETAAIATLSQPLTLCPGRTYNLDYYARASVNGMCSVTMGLGNDTREAMMPPTDAWELAPVDMFTVGNETDDASVTLMITLACPGHDDANSEGDFVDLDNIGLVEASM
ncbi:hypothetical protein BT63DRAFT_454817 [Microthyrium microscopicum]|uniref:Apple domain-containing protein n=1 Tax=Microthyrium microscopicum TaxID=703497 RepID=A0A6A6UHQ6_9PEZI|nr:hypothetical protein BT63DRAFT_454817 [Microthyrium microscopicum]